MDRFTEPSIISDLVSAQRAMTAVQRIATNYVEFLTFRPALAPRIEENSDKFGMIKMAIFILRG